ncbi:hypothetical protein EPUS_08812 [Endocarpon pusillum Z07020]|uniref:Life-span regulatory factor domain-containing protein n=1 Tax=Endocarpon pusillum (strain Z07020 / HMAS-L-300199) TaxID=1263415 RepID=U1I199_ENDPU|nr:uncharacterized protein EPUS_08812 [Endocarpon pusillum Z07020]ERF75659.1 hypothetical protein EPUS_08812 [Endocarpon pusillum Z07020]
MAASFLQFCATCEKQIFTPSNSILYCSEACRRKDSCKPLSLCAGAMTPSTTPPTSTPSSSPRPILPARIPTGSSYTSASFQSRLPTDHHNAKSDLDPTEWKPKIPRRGVSSTTTTTTTTTSSSSNNSEAFRYLSRFNQSTTTPNGEDMTTERIQRPSLPKANNNHHHHSTTSITSLLNNNTITTNGSTPSLSQTPTTTPSSLSTSIDYTTTTPNYDFNTRPLPPRHDPSYSSSAGAIKGGYDLVMPYVAPPAPPVVAGSAPDHVHLDGEAWEKQTVRKLAPAAGSEGEVREGLGKLFGGSGGAGAGDGMEKMNKKKMGEM